MKRFIEISAKSPEEAQELVKRETNTGEKVTGSEVLSAPTRGIFGIVGSPEFRIRFTIETFAEPAAERLFPEADQTDSHPGNISDKSEEVAEEPNVLEDPDEEELEPETSRRGGQLRKYSTENIGKNHQAYAVITEIITKVANTVGVSDVSLKDRIEGDAWVIEAAGTNVSQLIGKHGKTLDSLQYIVNIISNKNQEPKVKIILDVQGYRDQRLRGLTQLANRMYHKVIDSGRKVELEPMSTVDRRTIHLSLKDKTGIETFSQGVEPLRRVVIAPKKTGQAGGNPAPGGGRRREHRPPRPVERPASGPKTRSVPMFMGEEDTNEE